MKPFPLHTLPAPLLSSPELRRHFVFFISSLCVCVFVCVCVCVCVPSAICRKYPYNYRHRHPLRQAATILRHCHPPTKHRFSLVTSLFLHPFLSPSVPHSFVLLLLLPTLCAQLMLAKACREPSQAPNLQRTHTHLTHIPTPLLRSF